MNTFAEFSAEASRLSSKIDAGVRALSVAAKEAAQAEHEYRKAKAVAWVQVPSGTVPERQAAVDAAVAGKRLVRDIADGERVAALESLRSRRQQASMLQSLMNAHRVEGEFAKYGPDVSP